MSVIRPYYRTCRQFKDGKYTEGGRWQYMVHPKFANSPEHYIRGFLIILKDIKELFDYIEPADENLNCYSFRIHSLLLRACVEVEANCKAILVENGYSKDSDLSMDDYKKINVTHHLSSFQVRIPNWSGIRNIRMPFAEWSSGKGLSWYQAYNKTKHDRHSEFNKATFNHLLDAVSGLLVLLSAQFETNDFSPGATLIAVSDYKNEDGMISGIGDYFRVKFPNDWQVVDRYDFDWKQIKDDINPFQTIDYNLI